MKEFPRKVALGFAKKLLKRNARKWALVALRSALRARSIHRARQELRSSAQTVRKAALDTAAAHLRIEAAKAGVKLCARPPKKPLIGLLLAYALPTLVTGLAVLAAAAAMLVYTQTEDVQLALRWLAGLWSVIGLAVVLPFCLIVLAIASQWTWNRLAWSIMRFGKGATSRGAS